MKPNLRLKVFHVIFLSLFMQRSQAQLNISKPERKDIIANLNSLNELLSEKNYEAAKRYLWVEKNFIEDDIQRALERFIPDKEISAEGIFVLSSKGSFGTLADIFPAKTENLKSRLKVEDISEFYAITYGNAEVIGYWNGDQFKFLRVDDIGKLEDERIFEKVEIEASFPGGDAKWRHYLETNCKGEVAANNRAPVGVYTVVVQFVVNMDGSISNVKALTHFGYGMEQEAIRVIRLGPNWIPAVQNGRVVKAYRKQPITFQVTKE